MISTTSDRYVLLPHRTVAGRLVGRCECGVSLDLVAQEPDDHMACIGLRWCGKCGEVAHFKGVCPFCNRERKRVKYAQDAAHAARKRDWMNARYRQDERHAARKRAYERRRYAEKREAIRAAQQARRLRERVESAA